MHRELQIAFWEPGFKSAKYRGLSQGLPVSSANAAIKKRDSPRRERCCQAARKAREVKTNSTRTTVRMLITHHHASSRRNQKPTGAKRSPSDLVAGSPNCGFAPASGRHHRGAKPGRNSRNFGSSEAFFGDCRRIFGFFARANSLQGPVTSMGSAYSIGFLRQNQASRGLLWLLGTRAVPITNVSMDPS